MGMITLVEYASRHGVDSTALRHKAQRGTLKTVKKMGRDWFIDEDEPLVDGRIKSGKYKDWRQGGSRKQTEDTAEE